MCATVDSQCLEYLGYITLDYILVILRARVLVALRWGQHSNHSKKKFLSHSTSPTAYLLYSKKWVGHFFEGSFLFSLYLRKEVECKGVGPRASFTQ